MRPIIDLLLYIVWFSLSFLTIVFRSLIFHTEFHLVVGGGGGGRGEPSLQNFQGHPSPINLHACSSRLSVSFISVIPLWVLPTVIVDVVAARRGESDAHTCIVQD